MTSIQLKPREAKSSGLNLSNEGWGDWKWQMKNAIRSVEELKRAFPALPDDVFESMKSTLKDRRLQITPYYLSLIQRSEGNENLPNIEDPLWKQVIPEWNTEISSGYEYDGETNNWEMPEEMVTPITQHKYDNRVIVRLSNTCFSYCQFCYEALRTLEKNSHKEVFNTKHWASTLEYVRDNPAVEEVILSGGEPLLLQTNIIDKVLSDLRNIGRPIAIRIHTRALTYDPFRITDDLIEVIKRHSVQAFGLHVTHPHEITREFAEAVDLLSSACPILFANIPLLAGVNDDAETMRELCMRLYNVGVIPHYLYHFMPFSPGSSQFRTSVRKGIDIVHALKRHITNLAVPEFVLPHHSGKYTPPLLKENERLPQWRSDKDGNPIVSFTNWHGEEVSYPDFK